MQTRDSLAKELAKKSKVSILKARRFVDGYLSTIQELAGIDTRVYVPKLGVFTCVTTNERPGVNFATDEVVMIPAKVVLRFKFGAKRDQ